MASSPPAHRESSDNNHTYDLCFDIETRRQIYDNFSKNSHKKTKKLYFCENKISYIFKTNKDATYS